MIKEVQTREVKLETKLKLSKTNLSEKTRLNYYTNFTLLFADLQLWPAVPAVANQASLPTFHSQFYLQIKCFRNQWLPTWASGHPWSSQDESWDDEQQERKADFRKTKLCLFFQALMFSVFSCELLNSCISKITFWMNRSRPAFPDPRKYFGELNVISPHVWPQRSVRYAVIRLHSYFWPVIQQRFVPLWSQRFCDLSDLWDHWNTSEGTSCAQ